MLAIYANRCIFYWFLFELWAAFDDNDMVFVFGIWIIIFIVWELQAKRSPSSFQYTRFNNQLLYTPSPLFGDDDELTLNAPEQSPESWESMLLSCEPVQTFLEFDNCRNQDVTESRCSDTVTCSPFSSESAQRLDIKVGVDGNLLDQYFVPLNLIERWGSAMGILHFYWLQ